MKDTFHQYLPYTESQIKEIWSSGLIIPDANVLLNVYRYSEETCQQFLSILSHKKFSRRVWAPFQVMLEFHKNRINVILDQKKPLEKIKSIINKHHESLKEEFEKFGIHKFHPFIKKSEILEILNKTHRETLEKVLEFSKDHPDLTNNDPLLASIHSIFAKKFGQEFSDEKLAEIYEEGTKRYSEKIPPGYLDAKKGGVEQYGDLVLWNEILQCAKNKNKHVIFIIDEKKEDWWLEVSGKTIGPRAELKKEFRDYTGKYIHFYNSLNFFEHANNYLGLATESSTVDEMQKIHFQTKKTFNLSDHAMKILKERYYQRSSEAEKEDITSVEEMVEWFFENYKDPADGVPYESKEGGYQYFLGGPYDPLEVLQEEFPNVDFEKIEEAANIIYQDGHEWVRSEDY